MQRISRVGGWQALACLNNSTRTNTEITVSPYLFYKYELDTLVAASDNDA